MCDKEEVWTLDDKSPLCRDCIHCESDEWDTNCKQGPYKRDLVRGYISYHACDSMRRETGRCGPKGNLYQKKPKHDFVDRLIAWFHG